MVLYVRYLLLDARVHYPQPISLIYFGQLVSNHVVIHMTVLATHEVQWEVLRRAAHYFFLALDWPLCRHIDPRGLVPVMTKEIKADIAR